MCNIFLTIIVYNKNQTRQSYLDIDKREYSTYSNVNQVNVGIVGNVFWKVISIHILQLFI